MPNPRTFGQFKQDVIDLINRDDLTPTLADQFARDGLNRAVRRMASVPGTERVAPITIDANGFADIPTDFVSLVEFDTGDNADFVYTDLPRLRAMRRCHPNVTAQSNVTRFFYARRADKWLFYPTLAEGTTIDVVYNGDHPPINNDDDSVPLLYYAPEVAKYAALSYAGDYFDHENTALWEGRFNTLVGEILEQAAEEAASQAGQETRSPYDDAEY